ncbi:MAG TPA: hypothetical protein VJP80_08105 [Candidatus Saccharimonadales bacterium]|nr:hypothetical protein [Candidatus Saccharimonadales bacterium]
MAHQHIREYQTTALDASAQVVSETDILASMAAACGNSDMSIGFADWSHPELTLDERGIAFVDMNKSGRLNLEPGEDGLAITASLDGCTGVAGFAKLADESITEFVSHYDPMSQQWHFTHQETPINTQMWQLQHEAKQGGAARCRVLCCRGVSKWRATGGRLR